MNLNVNTLLLSVLLTSRIYSMEQNKIEIDETLANFKADAAKIVKWHTSKCSMARSENIKKFLIFMSRNPTKAKKLMKDGSWCEKNCIESAQNQKLFYTTRQCAYLCAGRKFTEKFSLVEENSDDYWHTLSETRDLLEDPGTLSCVKKCLAKYEAKISTFNSEKN